MLNKWIDAMAPKNSKMRGLGEIYMKAGKASGLDPRYLVAHSAVETAWGTSNLSHGGDPKKGNWYGIGAFDNNPNNGFNYGLGIVGGAKWIAKNFYSRGQKTLHKMRHNGGQHEYATAGNWDTMIASIMGSSDKFLKGGKGGRFSPPQTETVKSTTRSKNLDLNLTIPEGYDVDKASDMIVNEVVNYMNKNLQY
ncbi:glucosaminidase [Staphylococcus phage 80A]|uniref:Mannosyl-glycoprotein endo-beta-N-acetylglucosamidase-like domain-containing protein n=2 Tax=unclassified Sepunavirus TaxID=2315193 RepID=A0AAX3Y3D6_9CAUD|nr:glucosaminidase [Staphylococcus phage 80A]WJJ58004.1 glucosaminidase [Staphylococcus phage 80B]